MVRYVALELHHLKLSGVRAHEAQLIHGHVADAELVMAIRCDSGFSEANKQTCINL